MTGYRFIKVSLKNFFSNFKIRVKTLLRSFKSASKKVFSKIYGFIIDCLIKVYFIVVNPHKKLAEFLVSKELEYIKEAKERYGIQDEDKLKQYVQDKLAEDIKALGLRPTKFLLNLLLQKVFKSFVR